MKTIDKIIESKEAPKDKNVLWVNGDKLLAMVKGKWTPIGGGSSDNVHGGGSGGKDTMEYLDVSGLDANMKFTFIEFASTCKVPQEKKIATESGTRTINKGISYSTDVYLALTINDKMSSSSLFVEYMSAISAIAIDFSTRIIMPKYSFDVTTEEYINLFGGAEVLKTIPRITKEEYLNLEA